MPLRIQFQINDKQYSVPAKNVVCSSCAGEGVGLNSQTCTECLGDRVILEPDYKAMNDEEKRSYNEYSVRNWDSLQIEMMEQKMKEENDKD